MSEYFLRAIFSIATIMLGSAVARAECPRADLTGDCELNWLDVEILAEHWLESPAQAGDLNGDNDVNMVDYAILAENWRTDFDWPVVINEIHYNPDISNELVEYVELYNYGSDDIDISGWYFRDGISFQFDRDTLLEAGQRIVVAQNVDHVASKTWTIWPRGFPIWNLYGPYNGRLDNDGERIELCDADGRTVDEVDYGFGFPWPTVGDAIPEDEPGRGHSIQLVNAALDNDVAANWRSGVPTPVKANTFVNAGNVGPYIRRVEHNPQAPQSNDVVTVRAKVTDPDGVESVRLNYQLVDPGSYIPRPSVLYFPWEEIPMYDDGTDGDSLAGDGIYTVRLPGSMQQHRRLVRYRIQATDGNDVDVTVPYEDDPQFNFSYFVYDGVPAWRGSDRPGYEPEIEYGPDVLQRIPVYHLISRKADVEQATWRSQYEGSDYLWYGTLVYDGKVYDHVTYRARGGVWRYAMGKNMWKFDFKRGHYFQARDNYGRKYKTTWDKLNFSACIQQGSFGQRGEQGMFEAVSYRMFELAGVPSPKTHWIHFRIIDEQHEDGKLNAAHPPLTSGGTQFDGDFWGLYLVTEQMDGRFLKEHGLADGNLYKMESNTGISGYGDLNNQGPTQVSDHSDLIEFMWRMSSNPSTDWWRSNVNLDCYYSYRAVYHATHHGDITSKNHFFYHSPEPTTNEYGSNYLWWQLPWDVDLTWTCYYRHNHMKDPFVERGNLLSRPELSLEAKNRAREFCDLLFNEEQMNQLIDEYAAVINNPKGGLSIVDADRAMWDYHWVMSDSACWEYRNRCGNDKSGQGRFYNAAQQQGLPDSFEGMVQVMKNYLISMYTRNEHGQGFSGRFAYMDWLTQDSSIPYTPTVTATCPPEFPVNALTFRTSGFSDPQGAHTFAGMEWRIAEVKAGSEPSTGGGTVNLIPDVARFKYFEGRQEASSPDTTLWRQLNFDDSAWSEGPTPIGSGESSSFLGTTLSPMRHNYTSFFARKKFSVDNPSRIEKLTLEVLYDDGFVLWINDKFVRMENMQSQNVPYTGTASDYHNPEKEWVSYDLSGSDLLVPGQNILAIQVHNRTISSSDAFFSVRLRAELAKNGGSQSSTASGEGKYEITATWESPQITKFDNSKTIPGRNLQIGATYRVRCRMKDNTGRWSHWSEPVQFIAGPPVPSPILENLRVTEMMYNPADPPEGDETGNDQFEFIELKNIGATTLDLTAVSFSDGIIFDFADGSITTLAPGEFVLLVKNLQAFESRYGTALSNLIAGEYTGNLNNGGENVRLDDHWQGTILEFDFDDWYNNTDGDGFSLTIRDASNPDPNTWNHKQAWRPSALYGGSPGADDAGSVPLPGSVVINEVLAHSHAAAPDWVELHNTTSEPINIGGWFLSDDDTDDATRKKYRIADATTIDPNDYIVFYEDRHFSNPADPGALVPFALSENGEKLVLTSAEDNQLTGYRDAEDFDASPTGIAFGRYQKSDGEHNFVLMSSNTPGRPNAYPKVGPVVINEIMYDPPSGDQNAEYVELLNVTSSPVTLYDYTTGEPWVFDDGIELKFSANPVITIPANGLLLVVKHKATFAATYGSIPGVEIVEYDAGKLDNGGEKLQISMPGDIDLQGVRHYIRVDRVNYSDGSHPDGSDPWPSEADGNGKSLHRITAHDYGNDVINWKADTPSPGSVENQNIH